VKLGEWQFNQAVTGQQVTLNPAGSTGAAGSVVVASTVTSAFVSGYHDVTSAVATGYHDVTSAFASGYHDFINFARSAGHVIAAGARSAGHVLVSAAKVVGSATGITDAINCIRNPTLVGCLTAVGKLALTASAFADGGASLGVEAELEGGSLIAEEGLSAASDEGGSLLEDAASAACKLSFSSGTKVLLASGVAIPISAIKVGDKVLATNIRTGKTRAETVSDVWIRHDTDLYNLRVKEGNRTAVIHTTSSHPFWVPATSRHPGSWITASALRYGTRLRPSAGDNAEVIGGWTPRRHTGWMWDLTVPGGNDHDFYIVTVAAAVLVHNCGEEIGYNSDELSSAAYKARVGSGVGAARNVAAARVQGLDELVIGFSKGEGYHAEEDILAQLAQKGIDPARVTELYSEREPCGVCESLLNSESPGAGSPIPCRGVMTQLSGQAQRAC
jgi:Xanthomonas XOO_2897-like deaminase/Pretoxin HINT domain